MRAQSLRKWKWKRRTAKVKTWRVCGALAVAEQRETTIECEIKFKRVGFIQDSSGKVPLKERHRYRKVDR